MSTSALTKKESILPSLFGDLFKPWNELFDGDQQWPGTFRSPAVNISQQEKQFELTLAAPGLKKEDFKINVEGDILTISSEKENTVEEQQKKFTRKEYSYSSFSRSFTLPEEIDVEKIEASYEDGVLKISLPRKEDAKKLSAKSIAIH
jgi:HSP20 family protein